MLLTSVVVAKPVPKDKIPTFVIPKAATPPNIDGVIEAAEWREATAISGVANQANNILHPRPTTYWLAWDKDHIYLAARTYVVKGSKPRVGGRQPDQASAFDAGLELHFQPLGKNVPRARTDSSYKFFINALGFGGDYSRVSVGQMFKNWRPEFQAKTRLTEPGSAPQGGRWWECEVAMSTGDFELTGPHHVGDQWKLMLGFNHMPMWMQARIPANTSYFDPSGYCVGTLVENTPAVQVMMDELPGPADGVAAVRFRIFNPGTKPAEVDVLARFFDVQKDRTTDFVKKQKTLAVPPGKTAEFKVSEKMPADVRGGHIHYRVSQGNRELFRYYTYFQTKYPESWMTYTPPQWQFPLNARFNPVRFNLLVQGDAYYLDDPSSVKGLEWVVSRAGEEQAIARGRIDKPVALYYRKLVQLPELRPGQYEVRGWLLKKNGGRLGPEIRKIEKLDESKAFADWWNKGLGDTDRVIEPFTPMKRKGNVVSCWGRTYRLGALGLPLQVTSQGAELMTAPARIAVSSGGRGAVVDREGEPRFTETKDWRVSFTGRAEAMGLAFTSKGYIEQDGLCYVELTYAPAGGAKSVTVDRLEIVFPLKMEDAECLLCLGTGGNYSARTTMLIPRAAEGRLWSTLDTGRVGSGMTVGSFYPCVWLGNEKRGLLWWGDSDEGWVPDDNVPAHDVSAVGDAVELSNNIIGAPFEITGPRTIRFAIMASPFRPLVKNWRGVIWSEDGTFSGGKHFNYKWREDPETGKAVDGWNWLTPPSRDPEEWSRIWADYKGKALDRVRKYRPYDPAQARRWMFAHTSLPLVGYGWKSPDDRVTRYFAPADWGDRECYTDSNIDYYLYLADRAFREGGLQTIYWDIFFPCLHKSIQNGIAYELPDGRIQPGYAGFNTRRFMMRMYALMQDHGLTPGSQMSHATNDYLLVATPWMDAILDGEYHVLKDESEMDWVDGYPIERMRVLSSPHNWGSAISWMHLVHIKDKARKERVVRGMIDYLRLYDSWKGPVANVPESVMEWGILDERTEYVPFWRNRLVTCKDEEVLVSMWRLPDRVLLAVFNYNGEKRKDALLEIDLKKLGLTKQLVWQEMVRCRALENDDRRLEPQFNYYEGTITVPALDPHRGRLVVVRKY